MKKYVGMVSSDWSQCLSPNGPFDAFIFHYPHIKSDLERIFRCYTANEISLSLAVDQIKGIVPAPLTMDQMDGYLSANFEIYWGVDGLIRWCHDHRIVFMINTTGFMAYFQRIFAKGLLPPITALSAQSMHRFNQSARAPQEMIELTEIEDKATNSAAIAKMYDISPETMVLIGDSGGDGPHFRWGANMGATLVGSMTKPSLCDYCRENGVEIHHHFGHTYAEGEGISIDKERIFDFRNLTTVIDKAIGLNHS